MRHLQVAIRSVLEMSFPFVFVYVGAILAVAATLLRGRRGHASLPLLWIGSVLLAVAVLGLSRTSKDPYDWLVFGRYSPRYAALLLGLAVAGAAALAAASWLPGFVDRLVEGRPGGINWLVGHGSHILLILIPAAGFVLMWVLLSGEMNYFSRFQYALLPVLLISWPMVVRELLGDGFGEPVRGAGALVLAGVAAALLVFQHVRYESARWGADGKYDVAMLLRDYRDRGYLLATSEAGLLPFYSGWRAMDTWGLNDAWIAHNGSLTREYLVRKRPHVVMFYGGSPYGPPKKPVYPWDRMVETLGNFVRDEGYELAGIFGENPWKSHHYYVAKEIPEREEIVRRIRELRYRWYETGAECLNYALLRPADPAVTDGPR